MVCQIPRRKKQRTPVRGQQTANSPSSQTTQNTLRRTPSKPHRVTHTRAHSHKNIPTRKHAGVVRRREASLYSRRGTHRRGAFTLPLKNAEASRRRSAVSPGAPVSALRGTPTEPRLGRALRRHQRPALFATREQRDEREEEEEVGEGQGSRAEVSPTGARRARALA